MMDDTNITDLLQGTIKPLSKQHGTDKDIAIEVYKLAGHNYDRQVAAGTRESSEERKTRYQEFACVEYLKTGDLCFDIALPKQQDTLCALRLLRGNYGR